MTTESKPPSDQPLPGSVGSTETGGSRGDLPPLPTLRQSVQLEKAAEELANQEELVQEVTPDHELPPEPPTMEEKVKTLLVGKPLSLEDKSVFHHISLVAFLAWVGLGADGLSSSCYGPSEAFHNLTQHLQDGTIVHHDHLAIFLAVATMITVCVISLCYSFIIEAFPSGGGGYLVASKLLGRPIGVISGSALVVDYVLTVTTSIAAAGDALAGLAGPGLTPYKLYFEIAAIVLLIVLNLRGVKESVTVLLPIFLTFLATHAILIFGSVFLNLSNFGDVVEGVRHEVAANINNPSVGWMGMVGLLLYAYSMGAGTYTGIEAVSNSMPVMREPKVATAQRTMLYMAVSLAITAGGLMLAYLLLNLKAGPDKTMNHILTEVFVGRLGLPSWLAVTFIYVTVLSEGALLLVAAQAGYIDGPRVLANMAHDSYVPHWFGSLSERLATHNGILLIGLSAIIALVVTNGSVTTLLVVYSINVFLTFSISMIGMCRHWWAQRGRNPVWRGRFALFVLGALLCVAILIVNIFEKFSLGGWVTLVVTGALVTTCFLIHRYYRNVTKRLKGLDESLGTIEIKGEPTMAPLNPETPTAAVLVGGYSGLGVHTLLNALRFVPSHFKNVVFVSVGVVDSGNFKGAEAVDDLRKHCEETLEKYVDLSRRIGLPARGYMSIGTDVVDELEQICRVVARDFPQTVVFAGQLVFQRETWYGALLHNQTAYSLQRRLQWDGIPMVILPTRVREP